MYKDGFIFIFNKDKKQSLDKGLEKTKEAFSLVVTCNNRETCIDDEVLDSLEELLVTSDVGVETTLALFNALKRG
jgi:fused signal recognition particle receptor